MSDIVFDGMVFDRLRQIGDQSNRIAALESEVARLRLTDAELEALGYVRGNLLPDGSREGDLALDAICGLLKRTALLDIHRAAGSFAPGNEKCYRAHADLPPVGL